MRGLRIGFGVSSGLFMGLLGLSLGQCSFYLPERTLVCTDMGCKPATDQGPPPPDLKDPNDPSMPGSFQSAQLQVVAPAGISEQMLLGPSNDGTTLSSTQSTYPLVLMAPPKGVPLSATTCKLRRHLWLRWAVRTWESASMRFTSTIWISPCARIAPGRACA